MATIILEIDLDAPPLRISSADLSAQCGLTQDGKIVIVAGEVDPDQVNAEEC